MFNFLNRVFASGTDSTQKKTKRRHGRILRLEELESRDLLCATPFGDIDDLTGCEGSCTVAVSTQAAVADAPTNVTVSNGVYAGDGKWNYTVSWDKVADSSEFGTVVGYQILWRTGTSGDHTFLVNEGQPESGTTVTFNSETPLASGTYSFQVLAIHSKPGDGEDAPTLTHSTATTVTAPLVVAAEPLAKPVTPTVVADSVQQTPDATTWEMTISWTGDTDADSYAVYMNGSNTAQVVGTNFILEETDGTWTATIKGLTAGANYTFQVQALGSGAYADSDKSDPVSQKTVAQAVAPASVDATLREDKGDITLDWGTETPGLTYTVQYSIDGGKTWMSLPSSGNADIFGSYTPAEADKVAGMNMYVRGLVKEASYQFRVTVTNADKDSASKGSNSVTVTTDTVNTGAATVAVKSSSVKSPTKQNEIDSVTVTWNHNAANVGYTITVTQGKGKNAKPVVGAVVSDITFDGNKASVTISGLNTGTSYKVTVIATNALGEATTNKSGSKVTSQKTITAKTQKYTAPGGFKLDNWNKDTGNAKAMWWTAPKTSGTESYDVYVLQGNVKAKNFDPTNPTGVALTFQSVASTFVEWTQKDDNDNTKDIGSLVAGKYTVIVVAKQNDVYSAVARKSVNVKA